MTSCSTGSATSWRASSVLRTGPAVAPSTAASTGTADARRDFLLRAALREVLAGWADFASHRFYDLLNLH
jgi:hypothetical protein